MEKVFCGIDWAEKHHDVALVDADGNLVAKRRIADSVAGFAELTAMLADAGDSEKRRSRSLSRPHAGCWSPRCGPPVGWSIRSTRWRWPATGSGTRCHGRSPTTSTR